MSWSRRWVLFWDRREPADALAIVRIAVGCTFLYDLAFTGWLGLVPQLWGPLEEHGFGPSSHDHPLGLAQRQLGASSALAWLLFALACASSASLALGFFTRASAALFVLAYAQLSQIQVDADRGIDHLLRNVCILLAFSGAGATFSLEARLREGRWRSDRLIGAWPRYLIVLQLALVYFQAGMLKQTPAWTTLDGFSALSIVLQRPHFARFYWPPWLIEALYPLLQLSTWTTLLFERFALLVPLLAWLHETRYRGGTWRRLAVRSRLLWLWVSLGVTFHLALALLLQLGIFPWGCLALYPALAHPFALRHGARRLSRAFTRSAAAAPESASRAIA